MKKAIVYIIFLMAFCIFQLNAQTRRIIIQIDTIDCYDKYKLLTDFKIEVQNVKLQPQKLNLDSTIHLLLNKFPSYRKEVELFNDSSVIEIPIDFNFSKIEIYNAYSQISDTLRISKFKVYNTQSGDTTYCSIEYYKIINGELEKIPYKIKKDKKSNMGINPPSEIELIINSTKYKTRIAKENDKIIEFSNGHGYKPRKYLDKNGNYKKRIRYICYNRETKISFWKGIITLKKH